VRFSPPFTYIHETIPEYVLVILNSGNGFEPVAGSVLLVDDLEMIFTSIGVRGEYYQLNDSITALKPIFRAGVNFKLYPSTFLRVSYGQGYRFPSITERYIKTSAGSFAVFDNPSLEPESSWNIEIGLKQMFKFRKFYGYLDIAGFIQEYHNTIEYLFGFWEPEFGLAG